MKFNIHSECFAMRKDVSKKRGKCQDIGENAVINKITR